MSSYVIVAIAALLFAIGYHPTHQKESRSELFLISILVFAIVALCWPIYSPFLGDVSHAWSQLAHASAS